MSKLKALALLGALSLLISSAFAQVPTQIRSVSSLPVTCRAGAANQPTDMVMLVTAGSSLPYQCVTTNHWIPWPGSTLSFVDNGSTIVTPEPIFAPSFTITTPNTGWDFTEGDGTGLIFTTGHDYLFGNAATHCIEIVNNGVDTGNCIGSGGGISGLTTTVIPKATSSTTVGNSSLIESGTPPVLSHPRIEKIRYPDQFTWTQSPSGTLTGGTPATVTLTPVPCGINGTDNTSFVYISGVGTPEAVKLTGSGTAVSCGTTGTITFTPVNSHSAGYTIGTASGGIQEALNDAGSPNAAIKLAPTQGTTGAYLVNGAITPRSNNSYIDGAGAVLDCETTDRCINISSSFQVREVANIRFATNLQLAGAAITGTACAANVSTITVANSYAVGQTIDIQNTFNSHYWGPHVVASASGTQFTYTDTNCGGSGSIASDAGGGGAAPLQTAIEDNNQAVNFRNLMFDTPGGFTGWFNNHVVIDNDQGTVFEDSFTSGQSHCTAAYCGNLVYAPGPFSVNAAVIYMSHINASLNCVSNGVRSYAGNTLSIRDSVIQGFPQFGVMTGALRGGFGPSEMTNVYEEVGNCGNPQYTGNLASQAGVIAQGNPLTTSAGEGPVGNFPQFKDAGTGGATQKNYWIVVNDCLTTSPCAGGLGSSRPLYVGFATSTASGNITVYFPRVQGTHTVQYDLLETTGVGSNIVAPNGTANQAVLTAQAQCSTNICSLVDPQTALSSYAVPLSTYIPALWYWPGAVVLTNSGDNAAPSVLYTDHYKGSVVAEAADSSAGSANNITSVYAKECSPGQVSSPILVNCTNSDPSTAGGSN